MFNKLKQAFGIATAEPSSDATENENTNERVATKAEPQPEPLTQDDLLRQYAEQLRNATVQEREQYTREIENLLNAQFPQDVAELGMQPQPQTALQTEQEPVLSENPTVDELVQFITHKVTKSVEAQIRQQLQTLTPKPVVSPAYLLVDRMVKQHPSLATVADEALKLVEKLPIQYQTAETVDFVMWFLKGKRSEVEKKEAVVSLFSQEASPAPSNVTLPYSNEDINAYAQAMGIDPKRFKMRLLEEMQKSNR